jgi:hypothetical protein
MVEVKITIEQDDNWHKVRVTGSGICATTREVAAGRELIDVIDEWVNRHPTEVIIPKTETLKRIGEG